MIEKLEVEVVTVDDLIYMIVYKGIVSQDFYTKQLFVDSEMLKFLQLETTEHNPRILTLEHFKDAVNKLSMDKKAKFFKEVIDC